MLRLCDATGGVFVCHYRHNVTEILKVRVFMLIEHYDMLQETSSCGLENSGVRNLKPEYAKRTRLVVFLCMRVPVQSHSTDKLSLSKRLPLPKFIHPYRGRCLTVNV